MKKNDEKKGLVPLKEQPKNVPGEKIDVEVNQSGLSNLCVALITVILGFMQTKGEKMNSSSFEDIENNSILINQIGFFMTFFNPELVSFLKNENSRLCKKLEIKSKAKGKAPKIEDKIEDLSPVKMATINSGVMVFAQIIGNIVEHLENKDGNRMIEVDNKTLARILASGFKLIDGELLNFDSLAIYIGQGRKMASMINMDVLKTFFMKDI